MIVEESAAISMLPTEPPLIAIVEASLQTSHDHAVVGQIEFLGPQLFDAEHALTPTAFPEQSIQVAVEALIQRYLEKTDGQQNTWETYKILRGEGYSQSDIAKLHRLKRELQLDIQNSGDDGNLSIRGKAILKDMEALMGRT